MSIDRAIALATSDAMRREIDLMLGRPVKPAPDAGATMLGAYGLGNPTITWLLARYPFLLEMTPKQVAEGLHQPTCREWLGDHACRRPMYLDLRGEEGREVLCWHCPMHPANVLRVRLPVARAFAAPKVGLKRLIDETAAGRTLDWQADAYGDFVVVAR